MQVVFRLAYALLLGILVSLFVVLGTHTFYEEPEFPFTGPRSPGSLAYCDEDRCFRDDGTVLTRGSAGLTAGERRLLDYHDERRDYFRNVFIVAHVIGIAAVAAGLYLYRRVEALPLGLLLGGIGAIIYGWVESARGPDTMGTAGLFAVVTTGLIIVIAGGYWFLGARERQRPAGRETT